MGYLTRSLLSLVLIASVLIMPSSAGASATCQPGPAQGGLDVVWEAFDLLSAYYVEPIPPPTILTPARDALREEAEHLPELASRVPEPTEVPVGDWESFVDAFCGLWDGSASEPQIQRLGHAAIRAMAVAVDEGHTRFMTPEMYRDYVSWTQGDVRYEGIGARLRSNPLQLQQIFPESPAEAAGLRFGDIVLAIDGEPATELAAADAALIIRGEAGTTVTLTIMRGTQQTIMDIEIERGNVRIPLLEARTIDDIGYLHIQTFPQMSLADDVARELAAFQDAGIKALVLDLRGNSGGRLDVGTQIAEMFLPEGTTIYRQTTRRGQVTTKTSSSRAGWSGPLVVMVDEITASMGEILAAAIQEYGMARVVGQTSSGSVAGSIVFPLSDGAAVQITTLRIDSGKGVVLNNIGVQPDIPVELTPDDVQAGQDPQLDAALADVRAEMAKVISPPPALPAAPASPTAPASPMAPASPTAPAAPTAPTSPTAPTLPTAPVSPPAAPTAPSLPRPAIPLPRTGSFAPVVIPL
jgi:carboxyl-terminal processing protease